MVSSTLLRGEGTVRAHGARIFFFSLWLMAMESLGVGLGYRSQIRKDILRHVRELDFLEIVSDSFFPSPSALAALRSLIPCVPHSLRLSVGSSVEEAYLDRVMQVVAALDPPFFTDHLAFTHAGGEEAGHMAPVAYTRESLDIVVANVKRVQQRTHLPFALENIATPFVWPENEMTEGEFLTQLTRQTGCFFLLDLENVRINALNQGENPGAALSKLPLERVIQTHVAGGHHLDGFEQDTHAAPVSRETWALLAELVDLGVKPSVLIERDAGFPPFSELLGEVRTARAILGGASA